MKEVMNPEVIITRQNWHCQAGYCITATVKENAFKGQKNPKRYSPYSHWGKDLYKPEYRIEISDTKNCDYGKEPPPDPFDLCVKFCDDKGLTYSVEWF